jgi:hypothetical protein
MPAEFAEKFKKKYDLDRTQILDKVYRQDQPALFLSSFSDFLIENKTDPFIKKLVIDGFDLYFKTYIIPLKTQNPNCQIHMLGLLAAGFKEYLIEVAHNNNLEISSIIREPIYNLLKYYSNKN